MTCGHLASDVWVVGVCSCSSRSPTLYLYTAQLHSFLQRTFSLAFPVNLQGISRLHLAELSLSIFCRCCCFFICCSSLLEVEISSFFRVFFKYGIVSGTLGKGDVCVEQGHIVQHFGSLRIRSIMPAWYCITWSSTRQWKLFSLLPNRPVCFICFCLLPYFYGPEGSACMLRRGIRFHRKLCPSMAFFFQ